MSLHFLDIRTHRRNGIRSGWTLIEALVVIGILAILIALLLPAISAVRESARRLQCNSNLKQLGLAVANYASVHGRVPSFHKIERGGRCPSHVALMPYLELGNEFDRVFVSGSNGEGFGKYDVFVCPSSGLEWKHITYAPSISSDATSLDGAFGCGDWRRTTRPPPFPRFQSRRGLSQVAFYSELTDSYSPKSIAREAFRTVKNPAPWLDWEGFLDACRASDLARLERAEITRGHNSLRLDVYSGCYFNHAVPPNTFVCICQYDKYDEGYGAFSPNSEHAGGVFCVYGDGHVGFVENEIDLVVWQSQGDFR